MEITVENIMNKKFLKRLNQTSLTVLAGLFLSSAAQADALLEYRSVPADDNGMHRIMIKGGKLRMDMGSGDWLLFDQNQAVLNFIDADRKSYTVFDQEMVEKLGGTIDRAKAEMDKALAQMPAAQREQMRRMMESTMKQMMGGEEKMNIEIRHTGKDDQVSGIRCKITEAWRGNERITQMCLADAGDLDIAPRDAAVFAGWAEHTQETMQKLADHAQGMVPFEPPAISQIGDGLPVMTLDQNGHRSELSQHNNNGLDDDLFVIPANYERQSIDIDF